MIRRFALLSAALLSATGAAASDNRIRTVMYHPDEVVRLVGRTGIQSTIHFAPDEAIENVAVGDSAAWQITPNRRASLLFIKPLVQSSRTNMTVVTDRRTYMFDLVTGTKDSVPVYALKFHHRGSRPAHVHQPAAGAPMRPAAAPSPAGLAPERLYFGWKMKGADRLMPRRAFDDGRSLYLNWSSEVPIPAILTLSSDRKEGPVNYRTSGSYIVVDGVPSTIILRHGKKSATLTRMATPVALPAPQPAPSSAARPPEIVHRDHAEPEMAATHPHAVPAAAPAQPRAVLTPAAVSLGESKLLLGNIARQIADNEAESDRLAGSEPTL